MGSFAPILAEALSPVCWVSFSQFDKSSREVRALTWELCPTRLGGFAPDFVERCIAIREVRALTWEALTRPSRRLCPRFCGALHRHSRSEGFDLGCFAPPDEKRLYLGGFVPIRIDDLSLKLRRHPVRKRRHY
jgi:hypothetical protein